MTELLLSSRLAIYYPCATTYLLPMKRLFFLALLANFGSVSRAQPQLPPPQKSTLLDSLAATLARVHPHIDTLLPSQQRHLHRPDSLVRAHTQTVDSLLHLTEDQARQQVAQWKEQLTFPLDSLPLPDALKERAKALLNQSSVASPAVSSKLPVDRLTSSVPESFPAVHAVQERITLGQDQLTRYGQQATEVTDQITNASQAAEQWVNNRPEMAELQSAPEALQDFTQQPQAYQEQLASLNDPHYLKSRLQQELMKQAQDNYAGWSRVAEAQQKLTTLKKKPGLPGGQEVAPKKNALSGKPLGERLVYGGSVQLLPGPPRTLQAAPYLGYQASKRWLVGLSVQYQLKLQQDRRRLDTKSPVFGGSLFTHYQFYQGFLVHAEGEAMRQYKALKKDVSTSFWQANWLVGIGKTYSLPGQWQGKIVLLYILSHKQQTAYPKLWMVRFGFYRKK